jgi:hypothetical protein
MAKVVHNYLELLSGSDESLIKNRKTNETGYRKRPFRVEKKRLAEAPVSSGCEASREDLHGHKICAGEFRSGCDH